MASNVHWQWTPNGYLASLIGAGLAYGVTQLLLNAPALFPDSAESAGAFNPRPSAQQPPERTTAKMIEV
jgi:hypothetical protein